MGVAARTVFVSGYEMEAGWRDVSFFDGGLEE
jgi:hypothetical protein